MDKKNNILLAGLAALLIGGYLVYVNYIKGATNTNPSTPSNTNNISKSNAACVQVTYNAPVYNNAIVTYTDCSGNPQTQNISTGQSATISCLQGSDSVKYIPISASTISFTSPYTTGQIVDNKPVVAHAVQTMYNASADATLIVSYKDIYGNPATTTIPAGASSYIDCVQGTDTVQILPVVINTYTTQPNTITLVTYNDVNNTPQSFYVIDKNVTTTNQSSFTYTSPHPAKIIKGSDTVKVMQYNTVTYTAPAGNSISVNYVDWSGNAQQLFLFSASSTINCIKGTDSIVSTTPYDFTTPAPLYPVPTLGSIINSGYNLPSSVAQVCQIGQPCTQACIDAVNKIIQHNSDLIGQRYIKFLQSNGSTANSMTTQLAGNVGAIANALNSSDPNMLNALTQMYSSTNPNPTGQSSSYGGDSARNMFNISPLASYS